jgi:hypothetical protein
LLWWLLDRSPEANAQRPACSLLARALPLLAVALRMPGASALVTAADGLVREGLFGEGGEGVPA